MSYHLVPHNKEAGVFSAGILSFPVLLHACGYYWPCIHQVAGKWYCVFGAEPEMRCHVPAEAADAESGYEGREESWEDYPAILANCGFTVTAEEAQVMIRCARNFVLIQRLLAEDHNEAWRRDRMAAGCKDTEPWPLRIRPDITDRIEAFATWAERSRGFRIY